MIRTPLDDFGEATSADTVLARRLDFDAYALKRREYRFGATNLDRGTGSGRNDGERSSRNVDFRPKVLLLEPLRGHACAPHRLFDQRHMPTRPANIDVAIRVRRTQDLVRIKKLEIHLVVDMPHNPVRGRDHGAVMK
jgi:hypothetical protein